ncbi:hypothetical protein H4R18_000383 [Coemansia javaensis]|uniref:MSP domain-containing protein n=1 Tax=Coemansia javaensis TaxID=2761396 RepID=A0A9W8HGZ0_9FUNG|nr:hypothetical protein H4R18_000383 [Coemansia javaensis]
MASLPLIRISPSEFQFAESRSGYTSQLRLTSLQDQAVGFKLKTNAPQKFLVKPVVCSLLQRGMTVDVVVKSTAPITADDRFLIQTVALAPEEAACLDSAKWRTLDPSRIMEDLIYCTMGRRRPSVSSHGSGSPPGSPASLVAVSPVYSSRPPVPAARPPSLGEKAERRLAEGLARRVYDLMPGIDVADFSWPELALFAATCFALGFVLPLLRYMLF